MESIITGQKVARRRPYTPIVPPPRAARGLFARGTRVVAKGASLPLGGRQSSADFFLVEGARPAAAPPQAVFRGARPRLAPLAADSTAAEGSVKAPPSRTQRRRIAFVAGGGLALVALAALIAFIFAPPAFPAIAGELLPGDSSVDALLFAFASPELADPPEDSDLAMPPLPKTLEVKSYTVKTGDSIGAIAKRFGLTIDTLVAMNGLKSARALRVGAELRVPNMDGIVHVVGKGDTLASIAARYKIGLTALADVNDLGSAMLKTGQSIFIPGARLPAETLKQFYGTSVIWPIRGSISSYYGYRADPFSGARRFHAAIDIVAPPGTPVKAPMAGRVADTGYNGIYGNYIIMSHADGYQTLYGHLSEYQVKVGQTIAQGAVIGLVGNTGYSTGPHLHFGMFKNGSPVNPMKMLK